MVLILTNPIEKARREEHLRTCSRVKLSPCKTEEIIKLSIEGKSIKDIKKYVHGSYNTVTYVRTNARRQGQI